MKPHAYQPMYEELSNTAREYTLRMALLTSHATTSYFSRELSTAMNWFNNGLCFMRNSAASDNVTAVMTEQQKLAEDCQDMVKQDIRNTLQIAELTKEEMFHWQQRWAHALIQSAFALYTEDNSIKL